MIQSVCNALCEQIPEHCYILIETTGMEQGPVKFQDCSGHSGTIGKYDTTASSTLHIYLICIRPDMAYAAPIWSCSSSGVINELESVKKLTFTVYTNQWKTSYTNLLITLDIPGLIMRKRRLTLQLSFLYNIRT